MSCSVSMGGLHSGGQLLLDEVANLRGFDIARDNKRVKRLYVYQFNGDVPAAPFDAGLVSADGTQKRPGYSVVQRKRARNC